MIQTICEVARSMLHDAYLEKVLALWPEAINIAVYHRNRSPSSSLGGKSPYEVCHSCLASLYHLRPFGCMVYEFIPSALRRKFDSHIRTRLFVGYVNDSTKL